MSALLHRGDVYVVRGIEILGLRSQFRFHVVKRKLLSAGQPGAVSEQRCGPMIHVKIDRPMSEGFAQEQLDPRIVIPWSGLGPQLGQGQIVHEGDPAKLLLTESRREVLAGDRLLPVETDMPLNFYPSAPSTEVEGRIVAVLDGVSRIGQYNIVVLNRGASAGLEQGHVLEVYQAGDVVYDRYSTEHWPGIRRVHLPEEHAGLVLVFRVLEDISYALVTEATNEIRVADVVRNP